MPVVGFLRGFEQHGNFAVLRSDLSGDGGEGHDGLSGEQVSLHALLSFTSPSLQQMPPTSTFGKEHLPQTPATCTGLIGGQVSLQTPLSLTWPSGQQMPPTKTLFNAHVIFNEQSIPVYLSLQTHLPLFSIHIP